MEELRIENLSKSFGALDVLRDLSLTIRASERRVVIIGPNGAGKTTLFNLISGELMPSRGTIHLFGSDITTMPCYRRTRLGLARTFQITNLFPYLTLADNLLLALQAHDRCKYQMLCPLTAYGHLYEKAEDLLREMKLWEKKDFLIGELAHGETRLVEILLGIAAGPKMLLLDEPMAGLTSTESIWLAGIIQNLLKDVTLIIIEHDMDIAFNIAERMIVLHQGRIVADGLPADIRSNQRCREVYLGTCNE